VRFRCLLFTLILVGGATPLHAALGVVPQCLPLTSQGATADTKSPLTELRQVVPNYNAEDRNYLIRTIAFEASDESDEGKARRGLQMPFFLDRCRILPRVRRTSSILRSFGRDVVALYRHGRAARDSQSAGIPFTRQTRVLMRLSELYYPRAHWQIPFRAHP